jgi:hypothetical protein
MYERGAADIRWMPGETTINSGKPTSAFDSVLSKPSRGTIECRATNWRVVNDVRTFFAAEPDWNIPLLPEPGMSPISPE